MSSKAVTIYHNPRCSKSRQALTLLQKRSYQITIIEYLKTPLNAKQITKLLTQLQLNPIEVIRSKEAKFKELEIHHETPENQLITYLAENPILLERPIILNEDTQKAIIARPIENMDTIL